ncbi:hypothetical protein GCM10008959_19620 [Deinococcus seoulensis]|uniref:Carboxypeptidase regulatory-like domain-containing protein n=1 Tax=Deinococcus seoulensis TaxID=1837379 RepID=A0ABQ2RQM0_9DEIO|nr:hypothetical protein [Deinococcus seoulensis]GGR57984.1 hypothetical protein GCM10008959_19620 [Deinococcus seoulensis]
MSRPPSRPLLVLILCMPLLAACAPERFSRPALSVTPTVIEQPAPDPSAPEQPAPDGTGSPLRADTPALGLAVTVSGADLPGGVPVTVTLFGPAGETVTRAATRPGQVTLTVPYARAGLTPYLVQVGPHRFEGRVTLRPGQPVTPLTLKVGARGVRVNRPRPPALVLHPLDAQGNVTDLPVRVLIERPDGVTLRPVVPVRHLTAWTFLPPGRVTGLLRVTAVTGDAAGEVGEVDLLPGPVVSASGPGGVGTALPRVSDLRDELGNRVVDGEAMLLEGQVDGWNVQVPLTPVAGQAQGFGALPDGQARAEELRR